MLADEQAHDSLAVHTFEDMPVTGAISSFEHLQIYDKIQTNISKLKRYTKQMLYINSFIFKCYIVL